MRVVRKGVAAPIIGLVAIVVVLGALFAYNYVSTSSQISGLNQTILGQSFTISSQSAVVSSQGSMISAQDSSISAQSSTISTQSQTLAQDTSQISSLSTASASLEQNVSSLSSQKATLETQITSDQAQITADEANITALTSQRNSLQAQLTQADANVTALTAQVASVNSQLASLNSQVTQLQTQVTQLTAITSLTESKVEQATSIFTMPAATSTEYGAVTVTSFTAQYSGYILMQVAAATNASATGPEVLDSYAASLNSITFTGIYIGPYSFEAVPGTLIIPVTPGVITVYLLNAAEAQETATLTVTYYW